MVSVYPAFSSSINDTNSTAAMPFPTIPRFYIEYSALIGCKIKIPAPIVQKFDHGAGALHHQSFIKFW